MGNTSRVIGWDTAAIGTRRLKSTALIRMMFTVDETCCSAQFRSRGSCDFGKNESKAAEFAGLHVLPTEWLLGKRE